MANKVYDSQADKRNAPITDTPTSNQAGNNSDSRGATSQAGNNTSVRGDPSRAGDNTDANGAKSQTGSSNSTQSLRNTEETPSKDTVDNDTLGKGFTGSDKRTKATFRKFLRKRTFFLAGPVAVIVGIIFFLLIVASSLKLPDIMQEITQYEFARATSQFAQDSESVTDESLALNATDDATYEALEKNFTETTPSLYTKIRNTTWGRMDAYRPNKVIETLGNEKNLKFKFRTSAIRGRKILTDVEVADREGVLHTYEIPQVTSIAKWVPNLSSVLETKNNTSFLAKSDFLSIVNDDMNATETATLVRGATLNNIIGITGGSRAGLALSKFLGLDEADSQDEASIQTYNATEAGVTSPDKPATAEIGAADSAVSDATKAEVQAWKPNDPSGALDKTVATGADQAAQNAVKNALPSDLLSTTLNYADPLYGVFTPLCIIYDGSVSQSQSPIDNQMNQQENAFDQLSADAGQQEKGDQPGDNPTELANAVSGVNAQVGDTTLSVPYQRSEGAPVNTSNTQSAETGSDGSYSYSIEDALDISSVEADAISYYAGVPFTAKDVDFVTQEICSALTNTGLAVGLAGANLVAAIISFGSTEAGEEAAGRGAVSFITAFAKDTASSIIPDKVVGEGTTEVITRSALSRARAFVWEQGIKIGKPFAYIVPLTVLAKMVVGARSGAVANGLAQNSDLVDEADAGGNIEGNKVEQSQEFGAPLTAPDVLQANNKSAQYADTQNASKSFTDRYFALSNADSLVSHVALDLNGEMSAGLFDSILKIATMVFDPLKAIGSLLNLNGAAIAGATPSSQDYGNVQFGWTQAEETLIHSNSSYAPLENQHILDEDQDGLVEQEIAQKYAMCFGYSYNSNGNGDLDPTDPNGDLQLSASDSLGNLLAGTAPAPPGVGQPSTTGYIARDSDGNVINVSSALCSPENLSYDSPDCLADNPWSTNGKTHDMIFRWRLAMAYDTTLDQLISQQSVVSGSSTSTPTSPPSTSTPAPPPSTPTPAPTTLSQSPQLDTNWTGYELKGSAGEYIMVEGTVVVPRVTCPSPTQDAQFSLWVGLDGADGGKTVEQDGIHANCNSSNRPYYNTWYQMLPDPDTTTSMTVNPGDTVNMIVKYDASTNEFILSINNETSSKSFSKSLPCPSGSTCSRSTAEWITENHVYQDLLISLFGSGTFSNTEVSTASNSNPTPFTDYTNYPVEGSYKGKQLESVTYPLDQGVTDFTINQLVND